MILHQPDIHNTEASIIRSITGGMECKITKLAGMMGETDVWFYHTDLRLNVTPGPEHIQTRMGLQVLVNRYNHNVLLFNTWQPLNALGSGDRATLYFHGGEALQGVFLTGGIRDGLRKRSLILLNNHDMSMLAEREVTGIELLNHRTGRTTAYSFLNYPNPQYSNAIDGSRLLQIVCKRILAAKVLSVSGSLT